MLRHAPHSHADGEWTSVNVKHPCRVCGAHIGCRNGYDGQFAACLRQRSQWPLAPGGWIHRLDVRSTMDGAVHRLVEPYIAGAG